MVSNLVSYPKRYKMFKMRVFPVDFLIGGFKHVLFFHSVGNVIIPTDEVILIRAVGEKPPTRYYEPSLTI